MKPTQYLQLDNDSVFFASWVADIPLNNVLLNAETCFSDNSIVHYENLAALVKIKHLSRISPFLRSLKDKVCINSRPWGAWGTTRDPQMGL